MGSRQDSQGPLSRGIRGGGFVGSGGVGSVFRTSRGAESFDFDLAGKHPLSHVVNNGLQGHRPRKAPVHANRTSPKRPRPKPEETVAHDGDWRLLCEHADGSHEVFRVSNPPEPVFEKIRQAGGVSQKHRFMLREVLARNGIDVRRVTCLGWKHAPDSINRSERETKAYEREVARLKGANRPMEWLGPSGHELNLERMRLSLTNVAERPGLGG